MYIPTPKVEKSASLYFSSLSTAAFSFMGTRGRRRGIDWVFSFRVFSVLWKVKKPSTLAQPCPHGEGMGGRSTLQGGPVRFALRLGPLLVANGHTQNNSHP